MPEWGQLSDHCEFLAIFVDFAANSCDRQTQQMRHLRYAVRFSHKPLG